MTLDWTVEPNAPYCSAALLNGWWEFAPIYREADFHARPATYPERILVPSFWNFLPPELHGDWGAYRNFEWPGEWNKARAAGYRRTFTLPARPDGKILRIRFDAILAEAEVFLNGERVLEIEDGFLPYEADITKRATWGGENTLEVLAREHRKKDGQFMHPAGSWVGWNLRGIWQDCSLRLEPAVRIADVFVRPSVRKGVLGVTVTVENRTSGTVGVSVANRVAEEPIAMGTGFKRIPAGGSAVIETEAEWTSPKLWSPESPSLYWLETTLAGGPGGGEMLDCRKTRFGFKEFWIEGTGFVLNGKPIRFKGDSWHYMGACQQTPEYAREWFAMVKEIGANCVRLHAMPHPTFYLDLADEMGVCIIDESSVYGSGGNLALKEEAFWESARAHVKRLVLRDRNHASVCLWSACNEIVWKGGEAAYPKLLSLETAIQEVDSTRPVSFDENNSDLGGGARIYGGHYGNTAVWAQHWSKRDKPLMVNEFSALYYSGPEEPSLWGGEACYADFDARTRGAGEEARETIIGLRALGAASLTPWNFVWYGLDPAFPSKPVVLSPDPTGPGIKTQRVGAHSVTINYDMSNGKKLEPGIEGRRQPNAAFEVMRQGYAAQAAFVREQNNNFFDDRMVVRHVDVYNDVAEPAKLTLEWRLGELASGTHELDLGVYEHRLVKLEIPIPTLSESVRVPFVLNLRRGVRGPGSEVVHSSEREYWLVPRADMRIAGAAAGRRVLLIDEAGETGKALKAVGGAFERIGVKDDELSAGFGDGGVCTLVVGKNQLKDRTLNEFTRRLAGAGFFKAGGVLVALEGAFGKDVDAPLNPVERESLRAWRRSVPEFWSGIPSDEALRCWGQDGSAPWMNGAVVRTWYQKPTRGAFVPLAEVADGGEGLDYSPLLWLPLESGGVFVNGFDLVGNVEAHPAAAAILGRVVSSGGVTAPGRQQAAAMRLIAADGSDLRYLTDRVGSVMEEESDASIQVIDLSRAETPAGLDARAVRERLIRGGRAVLVNATPATLEFVRQVAGVELALEEGPWENVAKAKGKELDPALQGISQDDLCWVRRGQWEAICRSAYAMHESLEPLVVTVDTKWAGYAESAEQFKYALMLRRRQAFTGPHTVMGRIRIGEGELILSQLRVGEARQFTNKARRVWSLLLANAGARFEDAASPLLERRSPYVDENGYIRRWLLLGVYGGVEKDRLLSHDFVGGEAGLQPREGGEVKGKAWSVCSAANPAVDLRDGFKGQLLENVAGYMGVYVHSPRAWDIILDTPDMVDLAVGSDDGVRVWLNGEPVLSVDSARPWQADQNRVRGVKLRKGWNVLLMKVSQHGWEWKASARFLTTSGFPVSDLVYSLVPEGK